MIARMLITASRGIIQLFHLTLTVWEFFFHFRWDWEWEEKDSSGDHILLNIYWWKYEGPHWIEWVLVALECQLITTGWSYLWVHHFSDEIETHFMLLSAGWSVHRILMPNYCSWKKKYQALNNTTTAALLHIYPNLLPLSFGTDNESWYLKWYSALPHMVSISNHSRSGKMSSTFMIIFRLNFIQSITL